MLSSFAAAGISQCPECALPGLLELSPSSGFFEDNVRSGKEKEATLLMRDGDSEDCWTAYRFILKAKCIYYYLVTKRKQVLPSMISSLADSSLQSYHDYRVIPLKYATITWREKAEDDGSWMFSITTPIVTYTLKAKHKVAMVSPSSLSSDIL